ncbi:MAG TPA: ribonuclease H-like domain-containing protein [Syntrophales bacterium]|nr:ribonuclease H-like domain-containing protein [Syntrophales bacterium]
MSIGDKLRRIRGEGGAGRKEQPPQAREEEGRSKDERIDDLRRRIREILERRPSGPAAARKSGIPRGALPGEEVRTRRGSVLVNSSRILRNDFHGKRRICETAMPMDRIGVLAGRSVFSPFRCEDALFLDTETTGLSGGTGTFPFLVGLGWFEGGNFVVNQIFARDFDEEAALLTCLSDVARERKFLVTFNGRAFDLNLLATRYILNRIDNPLSGMPHLDLLFPSRRLLGHRLENSRLATLEKMVLGVRRDYDVPSSEIPQRYFDWLRSGNAGLMTDVLEHNRMDVATMAVLVGHLCDLFGSADGFAAAADGSDLLALARMCIDRGEKFTAERLLADLIAAGPGPLGTDAGTELSLLYKRSGRWAEAAGIWETMAGRDPGCLFALVELAKWHEHKTKNFRTAEALVAKALDNLPGDDIDWREALLYRLARIQRKMGCNQNGVNREE